MKGIFASILYDETQNRVLIWRDHIGIIPCYLGRGSKGELYVASELKAFHDYATVFRFYYQDITMIPIQELKRDGTFLYITSLVSCQAS